jgi:hypothetical protein
MKRVLATAVAFIFAGLAIGLISFSRFSTSLPSNIAVFHSSYVTNAAGGESSIITLSNSGPQTFSFGGGIETYDGRNWVYPAGIFVFYPGTNLLGPRQTASLLIPVPSSPVRWRAKVVCRDVHGAGLRGKLTRVLEDRGFKDWNPDWYFTQEINR